MSFLSTLTFRRRCPAGRTDAALVAACLSGDREAFVHIVERYQSLVCAVAYNATGRLALSEDAAQETFVRAWKNLRDLREPEKLRSWLCTIASSVARNCLRGEKPAAPVELLDATPSLEAAPDEAAVLEEENALVWRTLESLPEQTRLPLILFYREGESIAAVARALGLSEDAVKQRLSRGRALLRDRMTGLAESVLGRSRPTTVFTFAVMSAIGALAVPAQVARAAVAGGSTHSASSTATATAVTAMTSSKAPLAAAFLFAASLPVGYAVHSGTLSPAAAGAPVRPAAVRSSPAPPGFSGSGLFAEWVRLHEQHGHDAAAMPVLYKAISEVKDPFRRRAFRATLVAEWGHVDPAGGLDFFLKKGGDKNASRQLFREWLRRDPGAAMEKLTACGPDGDKLARDLLPDIAAHAPESVPAIAARLPENLDPWKRPVADAFAVLARKDLPSARAAAEAVTGPQRTEALGGVAKAWAATGDFDAAFTWAKALPDGTDRDGVIRSAILGLGTKDIAAALDKAHLVPPGGRAGYFADGTTGQLLRAAGEKDLDAVTAWIRDHPDRLSSYDAQALFTIAGSRLEAGTAAFLDELSAKGSLETLTSAVCMALENTSASRTGEVWEWLQAHPGEKSARLLRESMTGAIALRDDALALRIAAEVPDSGDGPREAQTIFRNLLKRGDGMDRLERLLPQMEARLRAPFLETAFSTLHFETLDDPRPWLARLPDLPEAARPQAAETLARAWTVQNPTDAARSVMELPADAARTAAVRGVAGAWLHQDVFAASEWIAALPAGADRDAGAERLVYAIIHESPDEGWAWTVSISDPAMRLEVARKALDTISGARPDEAARWIDTSPLPGGDKQLLHEHLTTGSSRARNP